MSCSKTDPSFGDHCFQSSYDRMSNCVQVYPRGSLYAMALGDPEMNLNQPYLDYSNSSLDAHSNISTGATGFFSIDQYKDLSLKEILDFSDELLPEDDSCPLNDELIRPIPLPPHEHFVLQKECKSLSRSSLVFEPIVSKPSSDCIAPTAENLTQKSHDMVDLTFEPLPIDSVCEDIMQPVHFRGSQPRRHIAFELEQEIPCDVSDVGWDDDKADDPSNLSSGGDRSSKRFRTFQKEQWGSMYKDLYDYRRRFGHCLVPHNFQENLPLARWVKRQRYQYKLLLEGKLSTMTPERVQKLENIDFVWDSQGLIWFERLSELREYKRVHGDCNVPTIFSANPRLATWVKCQRRQYRLFQESRPSNITQERINILESIGFEWDLRANKRQRLRL